MLNMSFWIVGCYARLLLTGTMFHCYVFSKMLAYYCIILSIIPTGCSASFFSYQGGKS